MPKSKKPAPKGGKKAAAPKKVAKKAAKRKPSVLAPTNDRSGFEGMVGPAGSDAPIQKLTERQIDQFNADKMRADAFASTQSARQTVEASKNFSANVSQLAAACFEGVDVKPKKKSIWHRFRSAITGLFVSKKYAEANPDTTIREKAD